MKKTYILLLSCFLLFLSSCSSNSNKSKFWIEFIDVGQGDSALICCDNHYMLIDGGDKAAGSKVYQVLSENHVQRLDILAISHLHRDHFGGLIDALAYASQIQLTIANTTEFTSDKPEINQLFYKLCGQLQTNGTTLTVPNIGETFDLGSAKVEVVDVADENENDALVLLITYGETRFLFTGDIEDSAQKRLTDKYPMRDLDEPGLKIDLIKMPHHGAYSNTTYTLLDTFMPDYAIISVGKNNYGHPNERTLRLLNDRLGAKTFRTDECGDIIISSDGKRLTVLQP